MLITAFSVTTGLIGTLFKGLSTRDACLTILFFGALAGLGPATFSTLGPRTGMRQVVQSRYSYGAYAVSIIIVLNLASSVGWTIINSIVAGQTLSALSEGSVSWDLGIGLSALIALVVAFMGYKVLHYYQRFAWIPSFIALLILAGCGASRLKFQTETAPATAFAVLSFASKVVSYTLSWSSSASDFCVYLQPTEPK
jgi:purine-cytosine permease-like protein